MQVVDVNGNMFGYDHLEIIGADGRPKTLDSGLTSVGLSMPSAFTVSNSPLTSNGTIGVTGAGTISQYIDGTGALRTFPGLTGFVPYVGANQTVDLNTQQLNAGHATFTTNGSTDTLTINHTSGSGKGIIVTKSGNGEGLIVVKNSGSGNAASITGGITLLSTLNLTNPLADTYIGSAANWNIAYNNRITLLTTTGTSGAASLVSHVLNIPQYQAQGNYITALSGEATGSGPGTASVTLNNASVTAKVLTGVNVTGGSINASDSILTAFGKLQNQINGLIGSSIYQGTWNALTNTPALTSGVGTRGYYYIVNVAGSTNLDGITDWNVGDWAIFDGTAWQQVDNTDSVTSVNGQTGAVSLTTDNIPEGATNLYFTSLRSRQALSLTTLGTGGLSTYDNTTGVLNIPNYSTALGGYVPYIGATQNVNLGEFGLTADQLTLDVSPTGTAVVGTTRWNNTIGSSETTLKGGSVILKNGVDLVARVVNKVTPNTTLTKAGYAAVRVSGAQGQRLAVAYAQADSDANSADTIGLVTETIATNQEGFIITVGHLEDINTTGSLQGETWADGDVLYLSPTIPGGLTNVKPNGSTGHIVVMGYVEYAHANHGKIYVKIMNGWELDELHNVYINNPLNNQGLFYETATQLWKNKSIDTALGYTPVPTTRQLTINGTAYDLSADRSWNVGTVTNIAMTVPTGLTVTGSPITSSGTFALGLQSGYSIPTTANQSNWTTAYNRSIVSAAVNYGIASTSLVLTQQNTGTITAGLIAGAATTNDFVFFNGSNLAYTQLNTTAPLSFNGATKTFSISQAGASTNGFLSSTDWNTFNSKQNAITLTTTGSSGAATLIGSTLNIPNYSSALSGYVPTSRQLTINGTSYDLSADRSWSVGTVTSIGVTAGPRIVSEDGPITSSGNITISHGIGQGLDVQTAQDLLNRTEDDGGDFEAFRCLATTLGELGDLSTPLGTFNYRGTVIQNIMLDEFGHILGIGSQTLTTDDIAEGSNLYFTDARARGSISLTTSGTSGAATYNSSTGVLNIPQYQSVITNPVTGTGTANYVARWTSSSNISTGVLYDNGTNVGIATTALGSWAKLQVAGNVALTGNLLSFSDNLAGGSTPAYLEYNYSLGKLIVGSYGPSALGHIVLETGGTEKVRITSTGNVGIGTTTPLAILDVYQSGQPQLRVRGTAGANHLYQDSTTGTTTSDGLFVGLGSDQTAYVYHYESNPLIFGTANAERMRITSAGNVLVGATSVAGGYSGSPKLFIVGGSTPLILSNGDNSGTYLQFNTGTANGVVNLQADARSGAYPPLTITTSATERMRITASGDVGIGTSSPIGKLDVRGASYFRGAYFGTSIVPTATGSDIYMYEGNNPVIYLQSADNIIFNNGYNVGIGTGSPGYKLDVSGNARANSVIIGTDVTYGDPYRTVAFGNTGDGNNRILASTSTADGMYFMAATGQGFNFRPNGGTANLVEISSSGSLGIGTDNPLNKLEIKNGGGSTSYTGNDLVFYNANGQSAFYHDSGGYVYWYTPQDITLYPGTSRSVTFKANGNVGINTTIPQARLDVNGDLSIGDGSNGNQNIQIRYGNFSSGYGAVRFYQSGSNLSTIHSFSSAWQGSNIFNASSGAINITGNTGVTFGNWNDIDAAILTGGAAYFKNNVGIGTTSPSQKLEVNGNVLANSLIKSGGTSSQYLMADGSVSTTSNVAPRYVQIINVSQTSYTTICTITGGSLASAVNISFQGTSGNVVVNVTAQILVNHYQDISITTTSGFYSQLNIRVISNNNETYSIEAQVLSGAGSSTDLNIEVFPLNSESVTFGGSPVTPGTTLVHTTRQGFYISATEAISISSGGDIYATGNVGIGTTSPGAKLHVVGNTYIESGNLFIDTIAGYTTNVVSIAANTNFYVPSGNVGIGTTSPIGKLTVNTGTNENVSVLTGGSGDLRISALNDAASATVQLSIQGSPLLFRVAGGSEAMRITSGGNVGIGNTSPNGALSFADDVRTRKIVLWDGAANDDFQFYGFGVESSTMIQSVYSNNDRFLWVAGTGTTTRNELMVVTGNGNVGIGTTSPGSVYSELLQVSKSNIGRINVTHTNNSGGRQSDILFTEGSTLQFQVGTILGVGGYDDQNWIRGVSNIPLALHTNSTERMRITASGNVGIGTTAPDFNLTINGVTGIQSSGTTKYHFGYYTGGLNFAQSGIADYRLFIQDGGNVGIGTGSPSNKLDVRGASGTAIRLSSDDNYHIGLLSWSTGVVSLSAGGYGSPDLNFLTGGVERMRITNGGNIGINTTSPQARLDVNGDLSIGDGSNGNQNIQIRYGNFSSGYGAVRFYQSGSNLSTIHSFSTSWNSGNIFNSSSGAINITGNTGVTFGNWNDIDAAILTGGAAYFKNNVGIGTTSPTYKLDVVGEGRFGTGAKAIIGSDGTYSGYSGVGFGGTTNGYNRIFGHEGTSDGLYLSAATGNGIWFWTNGSNLRMTISPSGNVGIGTTAPAERLDVFGRIQARPLANGSSGNYWYMIGSITDVTNYGVANGIEVESAGLNSYAMTFGTQNTYLTGITEKMRITSGGNVGIGTTSPNRTLTVNGLVGVTNGTANTQQFIFSIDGNAAYLSSSYIGSSSYVPMAFETGGAERMRITSGGNVGIGTTTPQAKLHINNSSAISTTFLAGNINGGAYFGWDSDNTGLVATYTNAAIKFGGAYYSSFNEWMRITNAGRLGIGTTTPGYRLEVNGGSDTFVASFINSSASQSFIRVGDTSDANYSGLALYSDSGSGQIFKNGTGSNSWGGNASLNIYNSNGSIAFHPNNTANAMFIATNGNVGIGTTTPTYKLDVVGDIRLPENNYLYFGNTSNFIRRDSSNILTVAGFSSVHLATFGSTRVAVAGSGDVGIGTTSPDVKLHVVGTSFVPTTMKLVHSQAFGTPQTLSLSSNSTGVSSLDLSFANPFAINIGGSEMMRIAANGSVGVGTTAPDTSSIMDLSSRRQGFLPPRMTNSEMNSIGSPATGLIVYDTTNNKVTVYNGSSWVPLH